METGRLISATDHGSVVMLYIETRKGMRFLAGDGNLTRRAMAELWPDGLPVDGADIEFEDTGWGGVQWFGPVEGRTTDLYTGRR